jgi:hypothetical protein
MHVRTKEELTDCICHYEFLMYNLCRVAVIFINQLFQLLKTIILGLIWFGRA